MSTPTLTYPISFIVLEDEPTPGINICDTLREMGYYALLVSTLDDAENVIKSDAKIDVLILDVHIHHEIPIEVVKETRRRHPATLIVGVTANPYSDFVPQMRLVCDIFLDDKPTNLAKAEELQFAELIEKEIENRREWILRDIRQAYLTCFSFCVQQK